MEFFREHTLLHKLVIVDGIGKCGKTILLEILSAFEGVEKQEFNEFIEYVSLAYKYNKIEKDIAGTILKTQMDTELYNNMIGRYINTRPTDATSVYNYHIPSKYLQRALDAEGQVVARKVIQEKPIYLTWSHDLINKSDIVFEAFENKLEYFYLNRNPIDIVYECHKAGYSSRMSQDPTEMQYCIKFENTSVPEIALGWEGEFLSASPLERTIKMVYSSFQRNLKALLVNKNLKNLYVINFEELVSSPHVETKKIENILKREPLPVLEGVLRKINCPRIIDEKIVQERRRSIVENVSSVYIDLLKETEVMYQKIKMLS